MTKPIEAPDIPFAGLVGVVLDGAHEGRSSCSIALGAQHQNSNHVAHGGVAFTLADSCMGMALRSLLAPDERSATIEAKINYLQPSAGQLMCSESRVVHKGRSIASVESRILVDGSLVCTATGTYAIRRKSNR